MRLILVLAFFLFLSASTRSCKQQLPPGCYKGKLEIKGGCMNYTISMQSTPYDSTMVMTRWTDENTGKNYKNVFGLGSRCTFPDSLNAGDEFYFTIDTTTKQDCSVCMMYYPTPSKKLSIKVLNSSCREQ